MMFAMVALQAVLVGPADTPGAPVDGYRLVWRDEFDGDTLDRTKWRPWRPGPRRDAINMPDAVTLDGHGRMVITTSRVAEDGGGVGHRTGGVWTRDTFTTCYGYFECRMKVQSEIGFWSAFWLNAPEMGTHIGDPARGGVEIDVMEYLCNGHHLDLAQHTIHWDGYKKDHKSAHHELKLPGTHVGFHTYGLEWTPDELIFFIDGVETWRTDKAVPRVAEFMILSCEVGTWAGDIGEADLPDRVLVDWVRVWKKREQ